MSLKYSRLLFPIGVLFFTTGSLFSQVDKSSKLFKDIRSNDSLLFEVGFDRCDTIALRDILSNNFEFYHDESGIIPSKAAYIESIVELRKLPYKARRQLIENTLEIYPLKNNGILYGAVETGEHQFFAIEKDKPEYLTSTAKFSLLWLLENGKLKLSRVFSYNHQTPIGIDTIHQRSYTGGSIDESLIFKDRSETEKWMVKNHIPALGIGYINDGKIREVIVYGKDETGKPNPDNMIFNVASLTKPITAMVALKLVNAGKWDLDEPIYSYWVDPDVASDPRSKKLTTRHILSHQTGLPNWRRENPDGRLSFQFDPGSKYQYSGEGFEYLRKALEHKFNKPLDRLANELIFQPLQMNDTHFFWDSTIDETRFARWHKGDGSRYPTDKNISANGADDLLTTIEDYSKFIVYIMNGADLKKDLYKEMISKQVQIKPRKYWGLSWWVDENVRSSENALINGGDDIGVHTIVFILPESKQGLLIFTNSDNGADIYIPTIQHYLGKTGQEIIDIETK